MHLHWLAALRRRWRDDRGDVPGWVMVCVMSAVLVVGIISVFEPEIKSTLSHVLDSITGN